MASYFRVFTTIECGQVFKNRYYDITKVFEEESLFKKNDIIIKRLYWFTKGAVWAKQPTFKLNLVRVN